MPTLTDLNAALSSDLPTRRERFVQGFPSCRAVSHKLEMRFEEGMTWENAGTYWKIGLLEENLPVEFPFIKPVKV